MEQPHERLRRARIARGLETATAAALAMGIPPQTYIGHENGTTPFVRAAVKYSKFFNVSMDWLLTGKGQGLSNTVQVVSLIVAGGELRPAAGGMKTTILRTVSAPMGISEECEAAEICGDALQPFRNGWLVFFAKSRTGVPENCLGHLCVCQVHGGQKLLREVYRGHGRGLYTLTAWNAPTREDVRLDWATRVLSIRTE